MRRASVPLLLFLAGLLLIGACQGRKRGSGEDRNRGSTSPVVGGTLRIPIGAEPASMNPLLGRRGAPFDLWSSIYPSLLTYTPGGAGLPRVQGDLARRWDWSAENRTLTVVLRTNRFWEDTTRVRGDDVVRTYEAYIAMGLVPSGPGNDSIPDPGLSKVEAANDSTVLLHFRKGFSFWRALPAAAWPVLPAAKLGRPDRTLLAASPLGREPLSAGPFRLQEWRPGMNLWLAANPFAPAGRAPYLRKVSFERCPGADARILRLALGEADVVGDAPVFLLNTLLPPDAKVAVHHGGVASVEMILWNMRTYVPAPLREAVSLAVDRDRMVSTLLEFRGERFGGPAGGLLEPQVPAQEARETSVGAKPAASAKAPGGNGPPASEPGGKGLPANTPAVKEPSANTPARNAPSAGAPPLSLPVPGDSTADSLISPDSLRHPGIPASSDSLGGAGVPVLSDSLARADSLAAARAAADADPWPRYDPARADSLLDAQGWTERDSEGIRLRGGVPLTVELLYDRNDELRARVVTMLEEDLFRCGIRLVPIPLRADDLWRRYSLGMFQTALLGFRPPTVPDLSDLWASWGRANGGGYASPMTDSLITAVLATDDGSAVQRLSRRIERKIRQDRPATFLFYRERADLLSPRVRDFSGSPWAPYGNLETTWLSDTTSTATPGLSDRPAAVAAPADSD